MFKNLKKEYYRERSVILPVIAAVVIVGFLSGILGGFVSVALNNNFFSWVTDSIRSSIGGKVAGGKASVSLLEEESETMRAVRGTLATTVSIVISKAVSQQSIIDSFPFDYYFPEQDNGIKKKMEVGGGSGFIISSDGLILTNRHVVADTDADYTVVLSDGKKYDAKVIARDAFLDLAVLKVETKDLPVAKLGDSDRLSLGQTVIAIGYSLSEYRNTVTKGIISGIERRISAEGETIDEAIQTDAAINPGNSGGPLINLNGEVVGINTAINAQGQLIGFAIPVNSAKNVIESVKKFGRIVRPWLGVRYILINDQIKEENKLPVNYGALIVRGTRSTDLAVIPGSPADKAGLKENDIILEVNSVKITEENSLSRTVGKYHVGEVVTMNVLRQGKETAIKVTLEEFGKK
jgi:S1-C subfamily serine protease